MWVKLRCHHLRVPIVVDNPIFGKQLAIFRNSAVNSNQGGFDYYYWFGKTQGTYDVVSCVPVNYLSLALVFLFFLGQGALWSLDTSSGQISDNWDKDRAGVQPQRVIKQRTTIVIVPKLPAAVWLILGGLNRLDRLNSGKAKTEFQETLLRW